MRKEQAVVNEVAMRVFIELIANQDGGQRSPSNMEGLATTAYQAAVAFISEAKKQPWNKDEFQSLFL